MEKTTVFSFVVNRDLSLKEMISAGKYNFVGHNITGESHFAEENFCIKGDGSSEELFVLVHLNREISTEDVWKLMEERDLCPADIAGLLAFGAAFPDEQRKYPIIELGSRIQISGLDYVALLGSDGASRGIEIEKSDLRWFAPCRFLAVVTNVNVRNFFSETAL